MHCTKIHATKKLQKLIKSHIRTDEPPELGKLGKWAATVFYINRQKWWLLSNAKTQYNLILPRISAADVKNFERIFKEAFYGQLVYDGILVDYQKLDAILGNIALLPTDNDRKATGHQNQRIQELTYWKHELAIPNRPVKEYTSRMNNMVVKLEQRGPNSGYKKPSREMEALLFS